MIVLMSGLVLRPSLYQSAAHVGDAIANPTSSSQRGHSILFIPPSTPHQGQSWLSSSEPSHSWHTRPLWCPEETRRYSLSHSAESQKWRPACSRPLRLL